MTQSELSAVYHELNFWKSFVETKRFLDGWVKNVKTPELRQQVHDFIKSNLPPNGDVMDAGSGVVSILNGTVPNKNLFPTDPLGELYSLIFNYQKYGIRQPLAGSCEELRADSLYDIVHISNALDHTQNPFESYKRLLRAVKPGGYLIIQCFENEAEYENWQGFHQFNLRIEDSFIAVTDKDNRKTLLSEGIEEVVSIERIPVGNKIWFIYITKKG
jgi:hypothetical protein